MEINLEWEDLTEFQQGLMRSVVNGEYTITSDNPYHLREAYELVRHGFLTTERTTEAGMKHTYSYYITLYGRAFVRSSAPQILTGVSVQADIALRLDTAIKEGLLNATENTNFSQEEITTAVIEAIRYFGSVNWKENLRIYFKLSPKE
jgi:hypothetical protein